MQELQAKTPALHRWHSLPEVLMESQQAAMWQDGLAAVYRSVLAAVLEAAVLAVLLVSLPLPSPLAVPPRAQLAVHLLGRRHRCSPPEPGLRRRRLYPLSSSDSATGQHAAHAAPPWLSTTYFRPMAVLQGRKLTCQT